MGIAMSVVLPTPYFLLPALKHEFRLAQRFNCRQVSMLTELIISIIDQRLLSTECKIEKPIFTFR